MSIFFSSDHHFFHSNIIKYCNRPFSDVDCMNADMICRWNATVGKDDSVIYCGDLSAGLGKREENLREVIRSLNGRKFLVRGNHDHQSDDWYEASGFEKVFERLELGGVLIIHYPLMTAQDFGVNLDELGEIEHVVHGHTHHAGSPNHENHFNVAVDRNDFFPVDYRKAIPDHLQTQFIDAASCLL